MRQVVATHSGMLFLNPGPWKDSIMLAKGKAPKVEFASERMEPAAYIPEGSGPADFVQGARHKARKGCASQGAIRRMKRVSVLVLDRCKKPLMPCPEKRALIQRADGYGYSTQPVAATPTKEERRFLSGLNAGVSAPEIG